MRRHSSAAGGNRRRGGRRERRRWSACATDREISYGSDTVPHEDVKEISATLVLGLGDFVGGPEYIWLTQPVSRIHFDQEPGLVQEPSWLFRAGITLTMTEGYSSKDNVSFWGKKHAGRSRFAQEVRERLRNAQPNTVGLSSCARCATIASARSKATNSRQNPVRLKGDSAPHLLLQLLRRAKFVWLNEIDTPTGAFRGSGYLTLLEGGGCGTSSDWPTLLYVVRGFEAATTRCLEL